MSDTTHAFFKEYCMICGLECTGAYCSDRCKKSDGDFSDLQFDDLDLELGEEEMLPALIPTKARHYSLSGGSVYSSTPPSSEVSPEIVAAEHRTDLAHPHVSGLDLGPPLSTDLAPKAIIRRLEGLSLDYSYNTDDFNTADAAEDTITLASLPNIRRTSGSSSRNSKTPYNSRTSSAHGSPATYTPDLFKLRRAQNQTISSPRRLSSNFVSPVLKPRTTEPAQAARRFSDIAAAQKPIEFQLPLPKRNKACGKSQCPSLIMSSATSTHSARTSPSHMVRRVSEPLSHIPTLTSTGVVNERNQAGSPRRHTRTQSQRRVECRTKEEGQDGENSDERGRSRKSHKLVTFATKRGESAHNLRSSQAPLCSNPAACVAATATATSIAEAHDSRNLNAPVSQPSRDGSAEGTLVDRTLASRRSTNGATARQRPTRFLFSRATPANLLSKSQSPKSSSSSSTRQTKTTSGFEVISNDNCSAIASSSSSEDEEEDEGWRSRSSINAKRSHLTSTSQPERGRHLRKASDNYAGITRSKSRHRSNPSARSP